jgi:hypothetical protein
VRDLRGCARLGAEPGDVDTATQLLAESALEEVATAPTGKPVYRLTCPSDKRREKRKRRRPSA